MTARPNWLEILDLPDGPPRDWEEVQRDRDKYLDSYFDIEQRLYLAWLEGRKYGTNGNSGVGSL